MIRYADDLHASVAIDTIDFMAQVRPMQDFFAARTKKDGTVTTRVLDHKAGRFRGIQHYTAFGATIVSSNTGVTEEWMASRTLGIQACRASRKFDTAVDRDQARSLRERGTAFRARVLEDVARHGLQRTERLAPGRLGDLMSGLALAVQLTDPTYQPKLETLAKEFAAARTAAVRDTLEVGILQSCITLIEPSSADTLQVKLNDIASDLNSSQQGERPVSSRKIGPILRTTLGIKTSTGTGNYTFATLERQHLTELATLYGLLPPTEDVKVDEERSADSRPLPPAPSMAVVNVNKKLRRIR